MNILTLTIVIIAIVAVITAWAVTRTVMKAKASSEISKKDVEIAALEARLQAATESREELKEANKAAIKALKDEVTAETEKILREREEQLGKSNKTGREAILGPLKESIEKMQTAMQDNAKEHLKNNTELKNAFEQAVNDIKEKTGTIGEKAEELATALIGRPKVQGNWGENFLDDILSREGLVKGEHYDREVANEDASRPDFVFHFKDGMDQKDLVVDSKVSLTAFVRYMNAETEEERKKEAAEHLASVRKHIDELAGKDYAVKIDRSRRFADYVLMFMPVDAAYRLAIENDPMLWQYAYRKGVLLATEQTIMPFLKIIRLTWDKFTQDSNIQQIIEAASNMIERVGQFYDSYKSLGSKLESVYAEYNKGIGKLRDDGHSITTSARQVMKFGARRSKGQELQIPEKTVETA